MTTIPVLIDARAAARVEIGGVERFAKELSARLPVLRPDRYAVARPPGILAHRAGHAWEQALLPVTGRRAELLYCPANLAPIASRRNVVVMHDAAPLRHPEWYSPLYVRWQRLLLPALARRARLVIAVSEFAKREIVTATGIDDDSVAVVPNGVDDRFRPDADPEPARAAHGLERPYVLALGSLIARKNLSALALAERRLDAEGVELVTAGSARGHMRPESSPPGRSLGYVLDRHLPGLYAGAAAFAMPSVYEGFGLPCLEAMACGTPVVAADRGALPETCGDAALIVDPDDREALADSVLSAALEDGVRERLITAGPEHASRFTWERTTRMTDEAIGALLDGAAG